MKRIIIIMVLVVSMFSGCDKGADNAIDKRVDKAVDKTVDNALDKTVDKAVNKEYVNANDLITNKLEVSDLGSWSQPFSIVTMSSFIPSIDHLRDSIKIECYRNLGEVTYSVHKVIFDNNIEEYAFITYKSEAVIDAWLVSKIPSKHEFIKISSRKTTLEQIKELDPATIVFGEEVLSSYHRFLDGSMMEIWYKNIDGQIFVDEFSVFEDPVSVVKNILAMDLKLVE